MNNTNEYLSRQHIPLLAPKLSLPRLPADAVEREALLARLDGGLERKLTLLCAPAGFGKTTLAGQWLGGLSPREPRPPVGWGALGRGDEYPLRLWRSGVKRLPGPSLPGSRCAPPARCH